MDNKQILTASLLDLVFDCRNKDYGAYELRAHYNRRVRKALLITGALIGITLTSLSLAHKWTPSEASRPIAEIVQLIELPPKENIPEPPKEQAATHQSEPVKAEILSTPRIVREEEVEQPMATATELDSAVIGFERRNGEIDDHQALIDPESSVGQNKGISEKKSEPEGPLLTVEVQAKFSGNWEKFLLRNLNGNVPVDNGAGPGRYQVVVQFIVDIDGSVSDIRPLSKAGYGMEEEAIRVLKKATKWEPAIQNGHPVKAFRRQPITFLVNED